MTGSNRRASGQAITEGAAILVLLVTAFVLMVAMGINLFFVTQWAAKVNVVAQNSAKVIAVNQFWLGMRRPDYVEGDAQEKAKTVANNLCKMLGLPAPSKFEFQSFEDETGVTNKVTVTVSGLPLPFQLGNVFPNFTSVTGVGVDLQPKQQIYAALNIACVKPPLDPKKVYGPGGTKATEGRTNVVSLPAFGFGFTPDQPPNAIGSVSGDWAPKHFRGLPLTNAFLNSVRDPLEFDPAFIVNGSNSGPYYGDKQIQGLDFP